MYFAQSTAIMVLIYLAVHFLISFAGNSLEFDIDNKLAFEIPLNNVSHSTTAKNEVTIEFHQNDDAVVSLTEIRFHIPNDPKDSEKDTVQVIKNKVLGSI